MQDTPDLSKIVNLIMQNPSLIAEISALAKQDTESSEPSKEVADVDATTEYEKEAVTANATVHSRSHRHELLSALKPYLSENRRQAVDSMMSISDILDMMRKR